MRNPRVLVVDDEDTIRNLLKSRLTREGFEISVAQQADEAEKALTQFSDIGVMITDIKMPGKDGIQLTKSAKEKYPNLRVIVITGHGEKEMAIQALRNGASDYLEKPFDLDELTHSVKRCVREHFLERDNKELIERLEARIQRVEGKAEDKFWFVSKASSMQKVNEWLNVLRREALRGNAEEPPVLITGESGTGKEGIARMVHAGSRRARGPWVAVNCANFNEQLLESELFGHEKGSFTGATQLKRGLFEIAKGGTLFLDELGEMDVKLQAKLLRVLQEKVFRRVGGTADLETDVRVITATNRNLQERVQQGKFREDLYHRLGAIVIELPALRERTEDVVPMATEFFRRAFENRGKVFEGFTPEGEQTLKGYAWPGNVRELLNVVERTSLLWSGNGKVSGKDLSVTPKTMVSPGTTVSLSNGAPKLELVSTADTSYTDLKKRWSDSFEKEYLVTTLNRHGGNVSAAAREAKLDRSNFLRLLRRHGLRAQEYRKAA